MPTHKVYQAWMDKYGIKNPDELVKCRVIDTIYAEVHVPFNGTKTLVIPSKSECVVVGYEGELVNVLLNDLDSRSGFVSGLLMPLNILDNLEVIREDA